MAARLPAALCALLLPVLHASAASFTDVTLEAGLSGVHGFRCAVGDVDGDGYPDLLLHRQSIFETGDVRDKQSVWLNVPGAAPGTRAFTDVTAASGVRRTRSGAATGHQSDGVVLADVDNDGDLDAFFFVYVHQSYTLTSGRNDLMLNDGAGHFTYAPGSPFHAEAVWNTTDAVWLDYDHDGAVDLAIGNYYWNGQPTTEQLYRGDGTGGFSNTTAASGIGARKSVTYALSAFDADGDGFTDLFVPLYDYLNSSLACWHWRNNGNGTFSEIGATSRYADNRGFLSGVASFGSMPRDYDNDGDTDFTEILVHGGTTRGKFSGPVRNDGGVFSWDWSRVKDRGSEDVDVTHDGDHQASWLDYDGDGLSDYVLTEAFYGTNNQIYLFQQDPDHTFRPVTVASGLSVINGMNAGVYDVIPLDYDRDGDEDLLVGFADDVNGVQLWRNDVGNLRSWTSVTVDGAGGAGRANRAGIGARIEVLAGGTTWTREVVAGAGQHAPQAPLAQAFGLGSAARIDRLRVRWPNAAMSVTERRWLPVNRFYTVHENCSLPADPAALSVAKAGTDLVLTWEDPGVPGVAWNVFRGDAADPSGWGAPVALWTADQDPDAPGIQWRDAGALSSAATAHYLVTAADACGESVRP